MELFLVRHSEWERLYNCSGVEQQLDQLYPIEKRTYPVAAWTIITLCAIYYVLYLPCMLSIRRHMTNNACYKLLFFIGAADMTVLLVNGFYHGYLSLSGQSFCSSPTRIYLAGALCVLIWVAESTADLILALNRCIDTIWPKLAKTLFEGSRVWIWLAMSTVYALYYFVFTRNVLFVPMYFAWFFNPFTGLRPDPEGAYDNRLLVVHNLAVVVGAPLIYAIFVVALLVKMHKFRAELKISNLEKMIFVQVLIISCLNTATGYIYDYIQYASAPEWLIICGHFAWFHIHGAPPLVYLALNRTIRQDCRAMVAPLAHKLMRHFRGFGSGAAAVHPQFAMSSMPNTRHMGAMLKQRDVAPIENIDPSNRGLF